MVNNFIGGPPPIEHAPGYKPSNRYANYPYPAN
jgi:hypothetical protein